MEERFDSKEYIKILGEELISDFIKAGKLRILVLSVQAEKKPL